ncbi:MAG: hypothetical protein V4687_01025 [Bacteroidota bacterium]
MKYQRLKALINHDMNPDKYNPSDAEVEFWVEAVPEINEELVNFMDTLSRISFGVDAAKRRISLVRAEHVTILNSLGRVKNPRADIQNLIKVIATYIDGVFERIDERYPNYVHPDQSIPDLYLKQLKEAILKTCGLLAADLERQEITKGMYKPLLVCLQETAKMRSCSFGERDYLQLVLNNIADLQVSQTESLYDALFSMLCDLNFNAVHFIVCYQEKIKNELNVPTDGNMTEMRLERYLWKFKKTPYRKKKIKYCSQMRSVSELMLHFVETEIGLREAQLRKEREAKAAEEERIQAEAIIADLESGVLPPNYKIKTFFSVDCLAYFFRLMVESNLIEAGVKAELIRYLSGIFVTPGTGQNGFSADSFYRKWRNPVHTNAMNTKAALTKMIKIIDAQF